MNGNSILTSETSGVILTLRKVCFAGGLLGLGVMTFSDTLAVIGRHIGLPFLGAIEVVQAAIVLMACCAMVLTTSLGEHASIRILSDRVGHITQNRLRRLSMTISALFALALVVGSIWIAGETWPEWEQSELLHIDFKILRGLSVLCACLLAGLFIYAAVGKRQS